MAKGIDAPVGDKNRITKPDPKSKKPQKFAPVANKPDDVRKVQLMLVANGYDVPVDGKCTSALIGTIRQFQKSACGFKKPDGIVDPGMKTWEKGAAKYAAKISADQSIEVMALKKGSAEVYLDVKEHSAALEKGKRQMIDHANSIMNMMDVAEYRLKAAEKLLQGEEGFMMAFAEFTIRSLNKRAEPPFKKVQDAYSAARLVISYADRSQPQWDKAMAQTDKATAAYNAARKAILEWEKAVGETAQGVADGLTLVRDVSFDGLAYLTAAYLVQTRKMDPVRAHMIATTGTEALKSSAGELGNFLAGETINANTVAKNIALDTAAGVLKGKLKLKFGGPLYGGAASVMAKEVAKDVGEEVSEKVLKAYFMRFVQSSSFKAFGEQVLKSTVDVFANWGKADKPPGQKEITDEFVKCLLSSGWASLPGVKAIKGLAAKAPERVQKVASEKLGPALLKVAESDYIKKARDSAAAKKLLESLPPERRAVIIKEALKPARDKAVEIYTLNAVNASDGTKSEEAMARLGEEALRRDAELRKMIQSELAKQLEKELKAAEKKK